LIVFVVPGRLDTPTGGYIYDRRIVAAMLDACWQVIVRELDDSFPFPTAAALKEAADVLASIPDGSTVVVDGLAGGAMPDELEREARRLRLVALVHHPLARETGLQAADVEALAASERRSLEHVRHVVVTSRATAGVLSREYAVSDERMTVIEPGTDEAARAACAGGSVPKLLCVATLTPRKGHLTLIRALAQIKDLDWRLTCVGSLDRDKATTMRVREEVKLAGLEDRVSFVGELKDGELAPYYAAADLFVLPTEYEGYGMAVAEAIAHGLPVISTPTGGIPDLVRTDLGNPAGILVEPGDVPALAAALRRLVANPDERKQFMYGAWGSRMHVRSWEAAAESMTNVLKDVAGR
jgi:glycosyltransferase involved in cell wall biosynthesis